MLRFKKGGLKMLVEIYLLVGLWGLALIINLWEWGLE